MGAPSSKAECLRRIEMLNHNISNEKLAIESFKSQLARLDKKCAGYISTKNNMESAKKRIAQHKEEISSLKAKMKTLK